MGNTLYLEPKGKSDQVQINEAFDQLEDSSYDTIYLKSGNFVISDQILTTNSFNLLGDKDAVLTVDTSQLWSAAVPMIKQARPTEATENKITISGFTIDGQADKLNSLYAESKGVKELRGDGYYNLMDLYYGDINIFNMTLRNSLGDGLIARYANVFFIKNKVNDLGHDVLYAKKCNFVEESWNTIKTMTNSGGRIQDSNHVQIYDNEIYTEYGPDAGGPGLQIQRNSKSMNDIEIYNNNIHDTYGPGIWLVATGTSYTSSDVGGVHIHDNIFKGCGTHSKYDWLAGIVTSGFYSTLIENNTFDGCYGAGILEKVYGVNPAGTSGKYNTIVQGNVIKNTLKMKCGVGGQALRNEHPDTHTIISDSNYIFDNIGGDYLNCSSTTDIYHAPITQEQEAFLMFECTEAELLQIKESYPEKTILRRS